MKASYHILPFRLADQDLYLIWIFDKIDKVYLNKKGRIPTFKSKKAIKAYAKKKGLPKLTKEDYVLHDMDQILAWIKKPKRTIHCNNYLSVWNLLTDVAYSLNRPFKGDQKKKTINKIYDKLFFGSNLPSVTPEGKKYRPTWSKKEKRILAKIMKAGIQLFKSRSHLKVMKK